MDADRFDAFIRSLRNVPRRSAISGLLGVGLAALLPHPGAPDRDVAARKRNGKKHCRAGKKKCGKKCIPKEKCSTDLDCGENERCAKGTCEPCLAQGTACTDDAQCCTGICDTYTEKCQQVRVNCGDGESCPNGRCCNNNQCLYEEATQLACDPRISCGYVVCGDACTDLADGTYQYCGFDGAAACRKGKCCCPKGVPLTDCPNIQGGTGGTLPRCD